MIKPALFTWEEFLQRSKEFAIKRPLPAKLGDFEEHVKKIWRDYFADVGNGRKILK